MADVLRGTNTGQDSRFKDKEAAAVKATKFPDHFNEKVDLRKVNISVLRPWIAQKVTELIRVDDDIVVEYVFSMLEDKDKPMPDPKKMQVSLLGFMDKYGAAAFMTELWTLLLSAQKTVGGVPAEFIEAKKAELQQQQQSSGDRQVQDVRFGRPTAQDSFDRRGPPGPPGPPGYHGRDDRMSLPPRPDFDRRGGPPPRERDDGYGRRGPGRYDDDRRGGGGGGYGGNYGGGGRYDGGRGERGRFEDRPRDSGYGQRARPPAPPPRSRSPSPAPRGGGMRRSSPPPRRPSPGSERRRSPSPAPRGRDHSVTPPARRRRDDDTPPMRRSPSPEPRRGGRGRRASRSRSQSRSPTVTPPRRRARSPPGSITPPRRRRASPSPSASPPARRRRDSNSPPRRARRASPTPSPPSKRRRDQSGSPSSYTRNHDGEDHQGVVKKGRGRFTQADDGSKAAEGPLGKSRWAQA